MARIHWYNCVYDSRRFVLSNEVREPLFLNAPSYSYTTTSNLRTLFVEQEIACGDVGLLFCMLCLFSMDNHRWTILDFKYGQSPPQAVFTSVLIFFSFLSQVRAPTLPVASLAAPDGSSCSTQYLPRGIYRYWIPMLSYESLLCVLVLLQGFQRFRSDRSIFRSGKRLVSNLIRDSVIYFLVCVFYLFSFFFPHPLMSCLSFLSSLSSSIFETDIFSLPWTCVEFSSLTWHVYSSGPLHA
jgi:hypothetical protein